MKPGMLIWSVNTSSGYLSSASSSHPAMSFFLLDFQQYLDRRILPTLESLFQFQVSHSLVPLSILLPPHKSLDGYLRLFPRRTFQLFLPSLMLCTTSL